MQKPLRVDEQWVRSFDGTDLACHGVGTGPPVLLCNGLGGSWKAWTHQIQYFRDRYRFLSWDYRGLYRSGPPSDPNTLRVEHQAQDAIAVLDAQGVDRVQLFGWSMGVQVALEVFRRIPDRVAGLVLMDGVAGRPWETVLNFRPLGRVLPWALRCGQRVHRPVETLVRHVVQSPETIEWAKRTGLAAATLDDEVFQDLAESFVDLDMALYLRTLELLGEHDATDVLGQVDVPTLVVVGDRDVFTPRRAAERMVRQIAGAELMVVPGGTHYVAVEYPELVNLRIEKFFQERGYAPRAA
jgi:pimeloyl-ACP methyl ester carboxylesterase